jgi:hypothetical protein
MKAFTNSRRKVWLGALGVAGCLALASSPAARSAEVVTAQTLIDRQQVLDLITRYYYNFGRENPENFSDFYADDAELILGATHYKGKEGILKAYNRAPPPPAADGTAPAAAPAPPRPKRYTFNVTISNPLIVVHGDTATSQVVFTEYVQEKQGDPTKMTTQGKEYGTFVKVKGQWRYKTRQIAGGSEPPAGWKE